MEVNAITWNQPELLAFYTWAVIYVLRKRLKVSVTVMLLAVVKIFDFIPTGYVVLIKKKKISNQTQHPFLF